MELFIIAGVCTALKKYIFQIENVLFIFDINKRKN